MEMISVPMHLKKSIGRTIVQHPTRVTSIMIRNELKELGMLGSSDASAEVVQDFLKQDEEIGDLYENHCVTIEALRQGFSREHIVPLQVCLYECIRVCVCVLVYAMGLCAPLFKFKV